MLAAMTGWQLSLTLLYIVVCILLIGVILLQKGRGGGIGAAFGGGAATSPFGAKTGDVFTWVTVVLAGLAILIAVIGNYVLEPRFQTESAAQAGAPSDQGAGTTLPGPEQAPPGTTPPSRPGTSPTPEGPAGPSGDAAAPADAPAERAPSPQTEEPSE